MAMVAIVGMPGSGKSEAAKPFLDAGFERVYFGGIVVEEVRSRNFEVNEANEKLVREELREKHGMAAMAVLSIPKIEAAVKAKKNVLIDGLYSWEELLVLREKFPELKVIAVFASPSIRHERLASRKERPLFKAEAETRDKSEIESLNKGGPIAIADFTILNEGSKKELQKQSELILKKLK